MKFSIIVVTYNRAALLNKFLAQFQSIEYPTSQYEIIIVDNGSTDYTQNLCIQAKSVLFNLRYAYESRGGQSFARNTGISVAKHAYLLFLDDDERFPSKILQHYASAWKKYPKSFAIGGKILSRLEKNNRKINIPSISPEYNWMLGEVDYGNRQKKLIYPETLFSGNLSMHIHEKSRRTPIFNTALGRRLTKRIGLGAEDYELNLRAHLQNKKIRYVPITVYNVIDKKRLTLSYRLLRSFLAGIEHNIIDKNLTRSYKNHIAFSFSVKKINIIYISFSLGYYAANTIFSFKL